MLAYLAALVILPLFSQVYNGEEYILAVLLSQLTCTNTKLVKKIDRMTQGQSHGLISFQNECKTKYQ
jgi:hypothetical protein